MPLVQITVPEATISPLVLIPGVSGSWLDDTTTGENLWLGRRFNGPDPRRLSLYPSDLDQLPSEPNVIATDAIRYVGPLSTYGDFLKELQRIGYTEYQVNDDPERRRGATCENALDTQRDSTPKLFVFAYDWRLSNAVSSQLLRDYIDCINSFYTNKKVNIVAHSMGGLVARRYILDNFGRVNRLITIATPWLGAPKAINTLATGEFMGGPQVLFVSDDELQNIVGSMPGPMELFPSNAYYDLSGEQPLVEGNDDWDNDRRLDGAYDYQQMILAVNTRFTRDGIRPADAAPTFRAPYPQAQDNWSSDNSGVQYYHVYGVTDVDSTIVKVETKIDVICDNRRQCRGVSTTETTPGQGDDTVPVVSSRRINGGDNYNAPGVLPVQVQGGDKTHVGMVGNPEVHQLVAERLIGVAPGSLPSLFTASSDSPPALIAATSEEARSAATRKYSVYLPIVNSNTTEGLAANANPPTSLQNAYYLTLVNTDPTTVVAGDDTGRTTSNIIITQPDFGFIARGRTSQQLFFAQTGTYSATFQVPSLPFRITIREGTGSTTVRRIEYRDLVLPAGAIAWISFTPQEPGDVIVDTDGDGIPETIVPPTADVTGSAAVDMLGPLITPTFATLPSGLVRVDLSASDASGVIALYYSLDSTTFQPYSSAFTINSAQAPTVYFYADDSVGNRTAIDQPTPAGRPTLAVRPVLECVIDRGSTWATPTTRYVAQFGYSNENVYPFRLPRKGAVWGQADSPNTR